MKYDYYGFYSRCRKRTWLVHIAVYTCMPIYVTLTESTGNTWRRRTDTNKTLYFCTLLFATETIEILFDFFWNICNFVTDSYKIMHKSYTLESIVLGYLHGVPSTPGFGTRNQYDICKYVSIVYSKNCLRTSNIRRWCVGKLN